MEIRFHKIIKGSRANGPGIRNVIWFQGCSLCCPYCFNSCTHDPLGGRQISVNRLSEILLETKADGITISGGEPFQQPEALQELLQTLKEKKSPPVLVFSGYTFRALTSDPIRSACLPMIDALICGPYQYDQPSAFDRFCSSANQELIFLSDRYTASDFNDLPLCEVIIEANGNALISGIGFQ